MYSPKIRDCLIPRLYRIAQAKKIPMTRLVNRLISDAISGIEVVETVVKEPTNEFRTRTIYALAEKPQGKAVSTTKEQENGRKETGVWPRQAAQGIG